MSERKTWKAWGAGEPTPWPEIDERNNAVEKAEFVALALVGVTEDDLFAMIENECDPDPVAGSGLVMDLRLEETIRVWRDGRLLIKLTACSRGPSWRLLAETPDGRKWNACDAGLRPQDKGRLRAGDWL